jgi:hypothetical protein
VQHPVLAARALVRGLGLGGRPWVEAVVRVGMEGLCWLQEVLHGDKRAAFWRGACDARYGCPELYMYSTADDLLDAPALDELVGYRKRKGLGDVRAWRVEDAPHVQLLRTHATVYGDRLRGVNEWGVNVWRRRHGLDDWVLPPLEE